MKKTPLKRKKSLRDSKVRKSTKKRSTSRLGGNKRKTKTPLGKLKLLLWEECKRIIRQRYGYTCYTCGSLVQYPHTGHFIPSSVCSTEVRYSLDNLRPQCYRCNINLSGNWPAYEAHLIVDHGRDFPDTLKKLNEKTKGKQYDIIWYEKKLAEYRKI